MNDIVKQSIDGRKTAIFNSYNITDQGILDKIDDLFKRINEFGEKFDDVSAFESEFANSPLNNEYINIFTEIAQRDVAANKPGIGEMVADRVVSDVKNSVMPSRAVIADARDSALRDIPVVGDAIDVKQKIDFFSRFKKNK